MHLSASISPTACQSTHACGITQKALQEYRISLPLVLIVRRLARRRNLIQPADPRRRNQRNPRDRECDRSRLRDGGCAQRQPQVRDRLLPYRIRCGRIPSFSATGHNALNDASHVQRHISDRPHIPIPVSRETISKRITVPLLHDYKRFGLSMSPLLHFHGHRFAIPLEQKIQLTTGVLGRPAIG